MGFLWSQFMVTPPYPRHSFKGKTVIVTGSNIGLGLEASRHIARLGAEKLILAVRNMEAGEKAKASIEKSAKRSGFCEVWKLDLSSYDSVKAFAEKAQSLPRLDVLLENAAISTKTFAIKEKDESTITVNVVSTFLLAFLLLPKLQETAEKFQTDPVLSLVASEVHGWAKFAERDSPNILATLSDESKVVMSDRYMVSKLLEVLVIRQIAPQLATSKYKDVTFNMLNPGFCHSGLGREQGTLFYLFQLALARSTEVGSRTLVHGAAGGKETHGGYMHDGFLNNGEVVGWVKAEEGERVGKQVWKEVKAKLEEIQPGLTSEVQ